MNFLRKKTLLFVSLLFIFTNINGQSLWKKNVLTHKKTEQHSTVMSVDFNAFKKAIVKTPLRNTTNSTSRKKNTLIELPDEKGNLITFNLYEAPVFCASLSKKYPQIKSYVGYSTKNDGTVLRMSVGTKGIQTMISFTDRPTVFMHPMNKNTKYRVYTRQSHDNKEPFHCSVNENIKKSTSHKRNNNTLRAANDQILRKFRIAISTTAEYTKYHGGTVEKALEAINATLTRVNSIYETDMAITFELIDATQLIYTDPETDPYSEYTVGISDSNFETLDGWNLQLQNNLSTTIGNDKYDIGHLFGSAGGGGNAGCIGCVCDNDDINNKNDMNKGAAYTSPSDAKPEGDSFDVDFVTHEIGHQMGANHTFAYNDEGYNVSSEPGSGSTIMGYAGVGGRNNVQLNTDPYFHYHSIKQIMNIIRNNKTCWNNNNPTAISNKPPVANAGKDFHIPKGTPYILKGSATDPNSRDNLTYCWEQTDSGKVTTDSFSSTLTKGSMNRSLPPSGSPNRYIPRLEEAISGNLTPTNPSVNSTWETIPTVAREMNWALTVRDREASETGLGGQSSSDVMKIIVEDVEPFSIDLVPTWKQGTKQLIKWNVGQTKNATINCKKVTIKMTINNGRSFKILAENTDNDGSETVSMPFFAKDTDNAKIVIEAVDNIFYAISNDFKISRKPDFSMANDSGDVIACRTENVAYTISIVTSNSFSENIELSVTGNPKGSEVTFSKPTINSSQKITVSISNLPKTLTEEVIMTLKASSKSITKSITLRLLPPLCESTGNIIAPTAITRVKFNTINQQSLRTSGYSNFKTVSTNIRKSQAYELTVHTNIANSTESVAWIDWNQNCKFEKDEEYILGYAAPTKEYKTIATEPLIIQVPDNAVLGTTVMRISTKNEESANPCEIGFNGETEDYTLHIEESLPFMVDNNFKKLLLYPNPSNGQLNIQFETIDKENIFIRLFDIRGKLIKNKEFNSSTKLFFKKLIFNNVTPGLYLLQVNNGGKQSTFKIVFE